MKAINFNGGVYGTTDVLFGAENISGKKDLKKKTQNQKWITGNTLIILAERFGGSNKVIK